jgi:hypothetical protein
MYKFVIAVLTVLLTTVFAFGQAEVLWEKSDANGTLPAFFGASTERGFGFGTVGENDRLYVLPVKEQPISSLWMLPLVTALVLWMSVMSAVVHFC